MYRIMDNKKPRRSSKKFIERSGIANNIKSVRKVQTHYNPCFLGFIEFSRQLKATKKK